MKPSSGSQDLDPLLMDPPVLPLLIAFINVSLVKSMVPLCYQNANVESLLKNTNFDREMLEKRLKTFFPTT